ARAGRGDEVERAGTEPVLGTRQRADRADLDGVAGEVRVELHISGARRGLVREDLAARVGRLVDGVVPGGALEGRVPVDADLLGRGALHQVDELVAGDLLGEPRTALAQHAALAVEQHLRGDRDRLGELTLLLVEAGVGAAGRHRLVLQRALAALVAHRAVQRV